MARLDPSRSASTIVRRPRGRVARASMAASVSGLDGPAPGPRWYPLDSAHPAPLAGHPGELRSPVLGAVPTAGSISPRACVCSPRKGAVAWFSMAGFYQRSRCTTCAAVQGAVYAWSAWYANMVSEPPTNPAQSRHRRQSPPAISRPLPRSDRWRSPLRPHRPFFSDPHRPRSPFLTGDRSKICEHPRRCLTAPVRCMHDDRVAAMQHGAARARRCVMSDPMGPGFNAVGARSGGSRGKGEATA